jgi:hypothetical protein
MNIHSGHRRYTVLGAATQIVLAASLLAGLTCSNLSMDGGFGSETTNGRVRGRVVLPDGAPVVGVPVTIRRSDYTSSVPGGPGKTWAQAHDGITDSNGCYALDSIDTGEYIVEINDMNARAVCKRCFMSTERQPVDFGTDTLRYHATVRGEINVDAVPTASWYVLVFGLERCIAVDADGSFVIHDLPAGTFRLQFVCSDTVIQPVSIGDVIATAAATTTVPPIGWRSSRQLVLNTSASGADVATTICRFPVLVRLTEGDNFLFSGARGMGEDVRFLSQAGRMLPYEIEHWDSAAGHAALWVLVDTIYGSNNAQYITMQWGSSNAQDNSSGAAVFDTADGYRAVWHLGGNCNDATARRHNGTECSARDTAGIAGLCKKFSGADSLKIPGLLGSPAGITLTAWARLDTVPASGGEVVSVGDAALIRMDYYLGGLGTMGAFHLYSHTGDTAFCNVSSGRFFTQTGWHLITFTVNSGNSIQALYIDGMNVRSGTSTNSINYSGVGQNTYIGKHGNGKTNFNFSGRIDEVRVYGTSVSGDYIRLCYMNQKAQDALVVFK